jgi:hypothetical protein
MTPPKTKEEWCLWRAQTACSAGRDVLEGEADPPEHSSRDRYALFLLLGAVGEIAEYLSLKEKTLDTPPK